MKIDRRLLSVLLAFCMILGMIQGAFAAELSAEYGPASYADIAASAYARMLLYKKGNGVIAAADDSGRYGLVDLSGRAITDFQYPGMWVLDGGLFRISDSPTAPVNSWDQSSQQGVISADGTVLLPLGPYHIECRMETISVFDYYNRNTSYYTLDWKPSTADAFWSGGGSWYSRARSGLAPDDTEPELPAEIPEETVPVEQAELDAGESGSDAETVENTDSGGPAELPEDSAGAAGTPAEDAGAAAGPEAPTEDGTPADEPEAPAEDGTPADEPEAPAEDGTPADGSEAPAEDTDAAAGPEDEEEEQPVPDEAEDAAPVTGPAEWDGVYDESTPRNKWDKDTIYIIVKDGKYGAMDKDNKLLVPMQYDSSANICGLNQQGYISVVTGESRNYTSDVYRNGVLVNTISKRIDTEMYYRDLVFSTEGKLYGVMTAEEEILIQEEFNYIDNDYNGHYYTLTWNNGDYHRYYGLYSYDGDCILETVYTYLNHYENNKYLAGKDGKYGVIGVEGISAETLIPIENDLYSIYSYDFVIFSKGSTENIYNMDGDLLVPGSEETGLELFISKLFHSGGKSLYNINLGANKAFEGYDGNVMPFVLKTNSTESGYATYYVNCATGENAGYIPYRASNINEDGYFIYQDTNGKYGIGGVNGLPQMATPLTDGVKFVPYSWTTGTMEGEYSVVSGTLPSGLNVDPATGEIAGIPIVSGEWEFTVRHSGIDTAYTLRIEDNTNDAVRRPNDYEISVPVGTEIGPNQFILYAYTNRTMKIEGPYYEFMELYIDGRKLTRGVDYEAHEGSTVITIYAQTFQKFGEGTHTISAEYREGGSPKGKLKTVSQNYTVKLTQPSIPSNSSGSSGSSSSKKKPSSSSKPAAATPTPTPTPTPTLELPFTDVSRDKWYYDDVKWVYDNEIMSGVTATSFAPEQSISQATIVTVLARMAKVDLSRFEDLSDSTIESGKWYSESAIWAKQSGILPDYSTFTGEEIISRDQMAIMLVKYLRSMGRDTNPPAQAAAFEDAALMSQDGSNAFQVLYQYNIFRGVGGGRMDPSGSTTRAQFAALVHRLSDASQ